MEFNRRVAASEQHYKKFITFDENKGWFYKEYNSLGEVRLVLVKKSTNEYKILSSFQEEEQ